MVIIGGGASGLTCALAACEQAHRAGRAVPHILILEATDKIGRPILRSGNGRCNFSNAHIHPDAYNHPECAQRVFDHLAHAACEACLSPDAPNPVVAFFERLGLVWREESEGRLYPLANKASVVLDVLRLPLERFGVRIRCDAPAQKVVPPRTTDAPFTLHLKDGELVRARSVIVAAGGGADTFSLEGLPFVNPRPVLGPLATENRFTKPLDNIRVRCTATLLRDSQVLAQERGEVQFRTYGVSGIAIFNLSRLAQAGDELLLDLAPDLSRGCMDQRITSLSEALPGTPTNASLLQGIVLPLVADQVLKSTGVDGAKAATEESAQKLEERLHAFRLPIEGIGDANLCQVHRGGFALDALDLRTFEVTRIPGLHVTGEALDMDGACGGFNLHWAFATGMLAGWHAERERMR